MIPKSPTEIISDFLRDASKIVFGSMVIGFFVSRELSITIFIGGVLTTIGFLSLAILLLELTKEKI